MSRCLLQIRNLILSLSKDEERPKGAKHTPRPHAIPPAPAAARSREPHQLWKISIRPALISLARRAVVSKAIWTMPRVPVAAKWKIIS